MSAKKTPAVSAAPEVGTLVRQPHGGALRVGGAPGNKGGGRPKSEVRAMMQRVAEDSIPMIADIIDGQAIKRVRVPLASVLKHARCFHCDSGLNALRPDQVAMVEIEGYESASPSERIKAAGLAFQFGVGVERGYDEALVGKLAQATVGFVPVADHEALHKVWVRVIGDHVRGVPSSQGGGE